MMNRPPPHLDNVVCLCKIRRDPDDPAECQDHHRSVRNRTFLYIILIILIILIIIMFIISLKVGFGTGLLHHPSLPLSRVADITIIIIAIIVDITTIINVTIFF